MNREKLIYDMQRKRADIDKRNRLENVKVAFLAIGIVTLMWLGIIVAYLVVIGL